MKKRNLLFAAVGALLSVGISALLIYENTATMEEAIECAHFETTRSSFLGFYFTHCKYECADGTRLKNEDCVGDVAYYCKEEQILHAVKPNRCKTSVEVEAEKKEREKLREAEEVRIENERQEKEKRRIQMKNLRKKLKSLEKPCKEQIRTFLKKENREPKLGDVVCDGLDEKFTVKLNEDAVECEDGDVVQMNVSYSTHKENIVVKDCVYWGTCKKKIVYDIKSIKWTSTSKKCEAYIRNIFK